MGPVMHEVIGPDMVGPLGAQPDAGAVVQPETAPLRLLAGHLQPLAPPQALDPLVVDLPADAGRGEYDVVLIVSSLVQPAIRSGFLEPLNLDLLPNLKDQFESMQTIDINFHDGQMYAACIFWGTSPMTVSSAAVPADADYGVLFDPKYAGKLAVWDDISSITDTATYMGYDNVWDLSDEELEAVKAKMIEQKPLLRKYWTRAGELIELFQTGEIVAANAWNYIANALNAADFPAHEILNDPPVAWIDNYSIVKGTKNLELAHQYINHIDRVPWGGV